LSKPSSQKSLGERVAQDIRRASV
jgi:transposase